MVEQGGVDAGTFAGEYQCVGVGKACCKLLWRGGLAFMKHADSVPAQFGEAVERADHILVVVGNDNAHGGLALAVQ